MRYKGFKKKENKASSTFIFGIVFNAAAFFTVVFLTSLMLSKFKNPLGASSMASFIALIVSGALSGFFTAKYKGERAIMPSGLCAVFFASVLFGVAMISCGGSIKAITALNLLTYVVVAFIFAAFAKTKKRRRR